MLRYFLFPHSSLSESEFRSLSILLPNLSLLQVVRAPSIPLWAEGQFSAAQVFHEQERMQQIDACLRSFQEVGSFYGNECLLASVSQKLSLRESGESRFKIQGDLRGKETKTPDPEEALLLEAGTFLEMALDLDEKERDLETGFSQAEALEDEFRRIIGMSEGDDMEDSIESVTPPLSIGKGNLAFMLSKRMTCWLRLFSRYALAEKPVLTTIVRDSAEELFDHLQAQYDRAGKSFGITRRSLASIPCADRLSKEAFASMVRGMSDAGLLESYWKSLEEVLRNPHDSELEQELAERAQAIEKQMQGLESAKHRSGAKRTTLSLTYVEERSISDLWHPIDKEGHKLLGDGQSLQGAPSIFLHLE